MLSVCIPIFNFNVKPLVDSLLAGQQGLAFPYEIVLIDDGSAENYRAENGRLQNEKVRYVQLPENIGRSGTRNEFLKHVRFNYLLFLDCDSVIISPLFLSNYMNEIGKEAKVVCGGRVYAAEKPPAPYRLHYNYGRWNESKPAAVRSTHPYRSFMTNNFMAEKTMLSAIQFNTRIKSYGHEDTLFGYELKKRNIQVKHIENPVLHGVLQTNEEFLVKTESALANLCSILAYVQNDPVFIEEVALLRFYMRLKKLRCLFLVRIKYAVLKPILKIILLNGYGRYGILNFYKLGFFAKYCDARS